MKRYDMAGDYTFEMVEMSEGDYVLYADMIRETIPRPDPDVARKTIKELRSAIMDGCVGGHAQRAHAPEREKAAETALLRLMGVE